jgi:hypothetical protein
MWVARKQGKNPFEILPRRDPKTIATLDRSMQPTINSLRDNLLALGPEPAQDEDKDIFTIIDNRIAELNAEQEAQSQDEEGEPSQDENDEEGET